MTQPTEQSTPFRPGLKAVFYLLVVQDTNRAAAARAEGALKVASQVYGRPQFAIEEEVWRTAIEHGWLRRAVLEPQPGISSNLWDWCAGG